LVPGPDGAGDAGVRIIWFIICTHVCIIWFMSPIMGIIGPRIMPGAGCCSCRGGVAGWAHPTATVETARNSPNTMATTIGLMFTEHLLSGA